MPLPGSRVIPLGWSRHHQPVATGGMNATCQIEDPARAVQTPMDPSTGTRGEPSPFVVVADVRCRVQRISNAPEETSQGDEHSTQSRYLIQVDDPDLSTLPTIDEGFVVVVTTAVNEPHLIGRRLVVTEAQVGSERFTRDLSCVLNHQQHR